MLFLRPLGFWFAIGAAAAVLAVSVCATPAQAERIRLKNGYEIEGWILQEDDVEVTLAVIRGETVGTMRIQVTEILQIDRGRKESLEAALLRAKKQREEEERARREREEIERAARPPEGPSAAPTAPAAPATDAAEPAAAGPAEALEHIVVEPTAEELEEIKEWIFMIGDTRGQAQGYRRASGVSSLGAAGPKALGKLAEALDDTSNSQRRMNAARAVALIAEKDKRLGLYIDVGPKLLARLDDSIGFVRQRANEALEAITGEKYGSYETQTADGPWTASTPPAAERNLTAQWQVWWRTNVEDKLAGPTAGAPADGTAPATAGEAP